MSPSHTDLTALVTGGSRGIGRAIALQLAKRGCRVAVHYRDNHQAAEKTVAELGDGARHQSFAADLMLVGEGQRLWHEVVSSFGKIDVLVNNAGIYEEHPPLVTDEAEWRRAWQRTIFANLLAPAELSHAAAQAMVGYAAFGDFGRGRIVNISSRGAYRGEPDAPAYGASKAGLNSLGQSLARALAPKEVYVFGVAPTWVETDMTAEHLASGRGNEIRQQHPIGRVVKPEEVAAAAVFCALDAPAAMTGTILDVNGASYLR